MQTKFWKAIGRTASACIAASSALLMGTSQSLAQPFVTPGGIVWDCTMSGSRNGLAQLAFGALPGDGTPGAFSSFELIVLKNHSTSPNQATDSRGPTGDGRQGTPTNSTVTPAFTNIFGAGVFDGGLWNFDVNGRIIGTFTESVPPTSCVTNTVVTTSSETNGSTITTTYTTNVTVDCTGGLTNGLSFSGHVSISKGIPRLSLVAKGAAGTTIYKGVPAAQLPDASGAYYGDLIQSGRHNTEFLTLTAVDASPFMNFYSVTGTGPGYDYSEGLAVLSASKKIGFDILIDPTNNVLRATIGSVNTNKFTAKTAGMQESGGLPQPRVKFNVTRNPMIP